MNELQKWATLHWKRIFSQLNEAGIEIKRENINKIIEETSFKVRSKKHPEYCPYYPKNTPCHPSIRDFNCLLCACPEYDSSTEQGGCRARSRKGNYFSHPKLKQERVWDCTYCNRYHSPKYIKEFLEKNIDQLKATSKVLISSAPLK